MYRVIRVCPAGHLSTGWQVDAQAADYYRPCGEAVGLKRRVSNPEAVLCTRRAYAMQDTVQAAFRLGGEDAVDTVVGADRLVYGYKHDDLDDKLGRALLHAPAWSVRPFGRGVVEKAQAELRKLWRDHRNAMLRGASL